MNTKTVCVLQHVQGETPGLIADALAQHAVEVKWVRPFRGERIPARLDRESGLVVMGGPMGVYEQHQHPFLRQEIALIEQTLGEAKPILGVCLGSQLLAATLGARVAPGPQKEIGWHPITLRPSAAEDRLWRGMPASFMGFHWHGDVFDLPRGTVRLAESELTAHQAFRYGQSAYGFLFHAEVKPPMVQGMVREFRGELEAAGLVGEEILAAASQHLPALQEIGTTVFGRWAELVRDEAPPSSEPPRIRVKSAAEAPSPDDGARLVVDRLWPRRDTMPAKGRQARLSDLAPSDSLVYWYQNRPERAGDFRRRYFDELDACPEKAEPVLAELAKGPVTLLFSPRPSSHFTALVLRDYLLSALPAGRQ